MYKVGGFNEFLPKEQLIFDKITKILSDNYKKNGYIHIQTPAVESNEILLKGGKESSKQIFGLYGLAQGPQDSKKYSLHFDLTLPFARYILDYQNELIFPFKRYQIQPVRRGERSQRGRYKELRQSDIDVIWQQDKNNSSKYLYYDAEVINISINLYNDIFKYFDLRKQFKIHINNKCLIQGFFESILKNKNSIPKLFKLFDDFYKNTPKDFQTKLKKIVSNEEYEKINKFIQTDIFDLDESDGNNLYKKGLNDLKFVINKLNILQDKNKFKYDPFIIRGLDYYTGTVFETYLNDDIVLGSIGSGGRYEGLTKSINPKGNQYEGVGFSIGVSRFTSFILENTKILNDTITEYLLTNFEETEKEILKLYNQYISNGNKIELYPSSEKLSKQFKYADKKGIPKVIILGKTELEQNIYKIKDMETGKEQKIKL